MSSSLNQLTEEAMKNLKPLVDSQTIIGEPIIQGSTMVYPISKVSFGFATGGGDLPSNKDKFGGGSGAGVTITPVAFLVLQDGAVHIEQIQDSFSTVDRMISMMPKAVDKVQNFISSRKVSKNSVTTQMNDDLDK